MDLGTSLLNTFVVLAVGTALAYLANDRFKALRHEIDVLRTGVAAEFAATRTELRHEIDVLRTSVTAEFAATRTELREEIVATRTELRKDMARLETRLETRLDSGLDSLRSDLTQVALAVGARGRAAQA
jgi:hypothetical protein